MARPRNADIHEMPDRGDGGALTHRQRKVLEVIRNSIDRRGHPPSMRVIATRSAHELTGGPPYSSPLERKGYLARPEPPAAIEVAILPDTHEAPGYRGGPEQGRRRHHRYQRRAPRGDVRPRCSARSRPAS